MNGATPAWPESLKRGTKAHSAFVHLADHGPMHAQALAHFCGCLPMDLTTLLRNALDAGAIRRSKADGITTYAAGAERDIDRVLVGGREG